MVGIRCMGARTVVLLLALPLAEAFQSAPIRDNRHQVSYFNKNVPSSIGRPTGLVYSSALYAIKDNREIDMDMDEPSKAGRFSSLRRIKKRLSRSLKKRMAVALFLGAASGAFGIVKTPEPAQASAPVMAVPKAEQRDPATDALLNHERRMIMKQQEEMKMMNQIANQIEKTKGVDARIKFEKEYKAKKEQEAKDLEQGLKDLKLSLLEQGICPFVDIEGQRQVIKFEKGIDLGKEPGTLFYLEKQLEHTGSKSSNAYKTQENRRIIRAMVQDMKNKGIDPVEYFETHQDKTANIYAMPPVAAAQLASTYEFNLERYGQVNVPEEGELSVLEKRKQMGEGKVDKKAAKAAARAKAKAAKEAKRKEKAAAKEAQKAASAATTATTAAAGAAVLVSSTGSSVAETVSDAVTKSSIETPTVDGEAVTQNSEDEFDEPEDEVEEPTSSETSVVAPPAKESSSNTVNIAGRKIPVVPLAGGSVVAAIGGGYAIKIMKDKAEADEEERERQFRLLMGMDDEETNGSTSAPALEVIDDSEDDSSVDVAPPRDEVAPISAPAPKKKKKRGFFGKKNKNNRETDINVLVSDDAKAPQFASLLAKILTYGAPGRFPSVDALQGKMPFEKFNLDEAKGMLSDAREESGITLEESAEVFAGVVNCMLIDIVDLASSTLKAKDPKATVDGISVVVDFMNHAASLYDSVAEGVTIRPVTYGGDLSKGKLEQMYGAYAASGLMSMETLDTDFDSRVGLLQDVFQISQKKAEGIATKAMQKNLMEMMKDGKGMEEMMKQFGGEGGLEGLAGGMDGLMDGESMDPEQLKQMLMSLKEMKESGAIEASEFEAVREQFKEAYGSSIDDVIKEGEEDGEFGEQDKELLELMKAILYD